MFLYEPYYIFPFSIRAISTAQNAKQISFEPEDWKKIARNGLFFQNYLCHSLVIETEVMDMQITATPHSHGHTYACNGFNVSIRSDERFFTIYDSFDEPCGTITRPRVADRNGKWESHLPNGAACATNAVGPRNAFRSFLIAMGL
jgi:hypothetical protein